MQTQTKNKELISNVIIIVVISIILMFLDSNFTFTKPVRNFIDKGIVAAYYLVNIPNKTLDFISENVKGWSSLLRENKEQKQEIFSLREQLQKQEFYKQQVQMLSSLMNSTHTSYEKTLVANLISISSDNNQQKIIINKGLKDNVFVGQMATDDKGVIGQVVEVNQNHSSILLATSRLSGIPVNSSRNNSYAIAKGIDDYKEMDILFASDNSDLQVGDLLITSGLDEKFIPGYPVATITEVQKENGRPFLTIKAEPIASFTNYQYILLIIP